jgi:hypothetical protein
VPTVREEKRNRQFVFSSDNRAARNDPSMIFPTLNSRRVTPMVDASPPKRGLGKTAKFSWGNNYGTTLPFVRAQIAEARSRDERGRVNRTAANGRRPVNAKSRSHGPRPSRPKQLAGLGFMRPVTAK